MHAEHSGSLLQYQGFQPSGVSLMETVERGVAIDTPTSELRARLFRETPIQRLKRIGFSAAYSLKKNGVSGLWPYWKRWLSEAVNPQLQLPDPEQPFDSDGSVGLVHDLSMQTLLAAYQHGIFMSGHFGTLTWTSPPERCVLFLEEARVNKNVRRLMRQNRYRVTFDQAFEQVIVACAGPRKDRFHMTWITPRIMKAYAELYDAGHVHSFEVWNNQGDLVGGGYGVAIGNAFFTESQFSLESNTSKYGFAVLNWHLRKWGYGLNDGKDSTPTLLEAGFRAISRSDFQGQLKNLIRGIGKQGQWQVEVDAAQCVSGLG